MGKVGQVLRNYVAIGAMGLAALLPSKLNAQSKDLLKSIPIYGSSPATTISVPVKDGPTPLEVIGNSFSQPNIQDYLGRKHLDWYGSGDVNNDEKIDSLDVAAIDTAKNDRSDIDGDGVSGTQNDKQILINYLNGKIPYLPGHWDELTTRDERVSWLEKMIKIDDLDTKVLNLRQNYGWVCGDVTTQEQINFYGISNIDEFIKNHKTAGGTDYFKEHNARFNIPVYQIGTISDLNDAHAINGVLVGNDPLNFNDRYKWSDYFGVDKLNVKPGDSEMKDGPVSINLEAYVQNPVLQQKEFAFITDLVKFNLTNNVPVLEKYSGYLTLNNPNVIKVHVGNLEKIVVDSGKFPDGTVLTPEFLASHGYKAIPDTSSENAYGLKTNLSYLDSDTTKLAPSGLGGSHYQFLRKFFSWIYSGGVTKKDSTTQIIEVDKLTDVEVSGIQIPKEFKLYQNYPNPYNPSTNIKYETSKFGDVTLEVYNLLGEKIESRVQRAVGPGVHEFKNIDMSKYSSGMYLFRVSDGKNSKAIKGLLVK